MSDMKKKYNEEVVPALTKSQGYKNVMQVPKLKKIVISMGIGSKMEKMLSRKPRTFLRQSPDSFLLLRKPERT